ncbi:tetratricopeptide (TPR) repeat protein [Dysgonomonadaceae bacterium PH5-43]|nr:tetratricopeptide (TPR) repeat protein [Dysgonomonadaceae bacterium PH5-43]
MDKNNTFVNKRIDKLISMNKLNIVLISICLGLLACSKTEVAQHEYNREAIAKRDSALFIYTGFDTNKKLEEGRQDEIFSDEERAPIAMSLLSESISLDSTYIYSYTLKAQLLKDEGRYIEGIEVMEDAFRYTKGYMEDNIVRIHLIKGILYELMDSTSLAKENYYSALTQFDLITKDNPSDICNMINRIVLENFYNEEELALEKLKDLKKRKLSERDIILVNNIIEYFENNSRAELVEEMSVY